MYKDVDVNGGGQRLPTSQQVNKVVFCIFALNVLKNGNDFSEKLRFKDMTQSINRWRTLVQ